MLLILKRNSFPSASLVNNRVPIFASLPQPFKDSRPTLHLIQATPSRPFVIHPFVLKSQAHEQKKHRANVMQHYPSPGSPSSAQPQPLSRLPLPHATSSPSSPPSPLPPTPTFMYPHSLSHRPPPWSCITECVQDGQYSMLPLSLYKDDFDVYFPGLDLKTDIANGFKEV